VKIHTEECEFVVDKNMTRGFQNLFYVGSNINVMHIAGLDRLKIIALLLYVDAGASELFYHIVI